MTPTDYVTPAQAIDWLRQIEQTVKMGMGPGALAIGLTLFVTQFLKAWDHALPVIRDRKPPEMTTAEVRTLAWGLTFVGCFAWYGGWILLHILAPAISPKSPEPRMVFLGIPAGFGAILLPYLAKKVHSSWDLDRLLPDQDAASKAAAAAVAPAAPPPPAEPPAGAPPA